MSINFGIDFGTTNSSICYFDNIKKKYSLLSKNNSYKIVSKVYSHKNKYFSKYSKNFREISYFKRHINKISFNKDNIKLKNLTKYYLNYLKEIINNNFKLENISSVFTVPTSYNHYHRSWYKNLLEELGFTVKRIISEPSAAAIGYYKMNNIKDLPSDDDKILVIDLGGGTTDISLLEKDDNFYQVIYNKGDLYLGGEDFTKELCSNLCISFDDGEIRKKENRISDKIYYNNSLVKLGNLLKDVCNDIKSYLDSIKDVILVGNGLRLYGIKELLESIFPNKIRECDKQGYLVVYGASILSNELENTSSDLVIIDSTSLSLGIETIDLNFSIIIPSNSALPASGVRKYLPSDDNESEITLSIYQGERSLASENEMVGELIIPSNSNICIDSVYQVKLTLDLNGIIFVKIRDLSDKSYEYNGVLKFKKSDNIDNLSQIDNSNEREYRRLKYEICYTISQIIERISETDDEDEIKRVKRELDEISNNSIDYLSCVKYKSELEKKYGHLKYNKSKGIECKKNDILESKMDDYSDNLINKYLRVKLESYLDIERVKNSELKDLVKNLLDNYDSYELYEIKSKIDEIDIVLENKTSYREFKELVLTLEYEIESENISLSEIQKKLILERLELDKEYIDKEYDMDYEKKINDLNKFCEDLLKI